MKPLVSCVVPVHNGERYLKAALDSIFSQAYEPVDVIVVDDGSTDGTPGLAASYCDRIRYIRQSNRGPVVARNVGIRAARGEFVAFLDADDLWHEAKLQRQIACFDADSQLDFCVAHALNFWEAALHAEAERLRDHPRAGAVPAYVTGTLVVKRSLFDAVGGFNETLAHGDSAEWFLRARAAGARGHLLEDVLLFRRMHDTNRSRIRAVNSRQEFLGLLKSNLDRKRAAER